MTRATTAPAVALRVVRSSRAAARRSTASSTTARRPRCLALAAGAAPGGDRIRRGVGRGSAMLLALFVAVNVRLARARRRWPVSQASWDGGARGARQRARGARAAARRDRRAAFAARAERGGAAAHPRPRARASPRARSSAARGRMARGDRAPMAPRRLGADQPAATRHRARLRRARAARRRITEVLRCAPHRRGGASRRDPYRRARAGGRTITSGTEDPGDECTTKTSCARVWRAAEWPRHTARARGVRGEGPDVGGDRADGRRERARRARPKRASCARRRTIGRTSSSMACR